MWKYYALLSALFAALTAIFAKIGVKDINSDLATAIRTSVVLCITWGIVVAGNHVGEAKGITAHTWLFLVLSGAATGLSWLFYFKAPQSDFDLMRKILAEDGVPVLAERMPQLREALQTGDVARVAPIDKLSVVITIGLALIFLRETVSVRVIVGALFITVGSIMMLYK